MSDHINGLLITLSYNESVIKLIIRFSPNCVCLFQWLSDRKKRDLQKKNVGELLYHFMRNNVINIHLCILCKIVFEADLKLGHPLI